MTGDEFYKEALEREGWPEDDLCDPPTDPRLAVHVLIDHFLGKDWYVVMPENDDQVITAAVADILDKHQKKIPWGLIILSVVNVIASFCAMVFG